jgi:hypothetical protein
LWRGRCVAVVLYVNGTAGDAGDLSHWHGILPHDTKNIWFFCSDFGREMEIHGV